MLTNVSSAMENQVVHSGDFALQIYISIFLSILLLVLSIKY